MAETHLGQTFDIHGGGIDLIFPHHENEVAQSRCAFGTRLMAQVWMHNGFLQIEGQKMSKSEGNFITIRDLLADWPGEVLRFNMLRTHYRQPIDWTLRGLEESRKVLDRWYAIAGDSRPSTGHNALMAKVLEPLLDDLNTPLAIAALHGIADSAASDGDGDEKKMFRASLNLLGLLEKSGAEWATWRPAGLALDEARIAELIAARSAARSARNWARADEVRAELDGMGIVVKDGPAGTSWELKR